MPHIKSLFRSPPLSTPTVNYYDWVLGRPELKSWPDFTLHIDAVTGDRRQVREVLERFEHAATALAASPRDGGLGLVAGKHVVGILSENCLVCLKIPFRGHLCRLPTMLPPKEYPVLVFALLKIAVPIAFIPSQSTLQETVELLKLSGVTRLFASEQLYPHAAAAAKMIGFSEKSIFILQGEVAGKASLPRLIGNVKARGLPKTATREVQDDTLAYFMFSSGTTGLPKGYFFRVSFFATILKVEWI
jgi:acyl-CoA synthetase (AMP-forming)/AMP-acid ligase II